MQTAGYSTFLHDLPQSSIDATGDLNDDDDQVDSGSALEDSPRDGSRDDDDYQPNIGDHDDDNEENSGDGPTDGVLGAGGTAERPHQHQQTDSGAGPSYPQAYTLTYTPAAQDYINPYFYTPPQHNPYSVSGGQGEYYPTAMAQNPVPVPAIALPTNTGNAVVPNLSSVPAPSLPSGLPFQPYNPPSPATSQPAKRPRRSNAVALDPDIDNRPIEELYTELPTTVVRPVQPRVTQAKFQCTMCDARFPRKNAVVAHIKTHLGKKKYTCSHTGCNMAFVREHDCKRHETTHTGTRSHICYCGRPFARPDALRRHKEKGTCNDLAPPPPPPVTPPQPDTSTEAQPSVGPALVPFTPEEHAHFLSLTGQLGQMQPPGSSASVDGQNPIATTDPTLTGPTNGNASPTKPLRWQAVSTGPKKPGKRPKKSKPIISDEVEASLTSENHQHHHAAMSDVAGNLMYDPTVFSSSDMMDGHHPVQFMQFAHGMPPPLPPPVGSGPPPLPHMSDFSHSQGNGGGSSHHFLPGQLPYPYPPHHVYGLHHHHNGAAPPTFQPNHHQDDPTPNFQDHHSGQPPPSFLPPHDFNTATLQPTLDGTPLLQHHIPAPESSRHESPSGPSAHPDGTTGMSLVELAVGAATRAQRKRKRREAADDGGDSTGAGGELDGQQQQQLPVHAMRVSSSSHPHSMALNMELVYPSSEMTAGELDGIVNHHETDDGSSGIAADGGGSTPARQKRGSGGKKSSGSKGKTKGKGVATA
ncbi:hypothetical protein FRB93_008667 [Tulasnella sp. JGI-2019a]|nr:hypothetical protein FRB93_008667 [Tulasnella sp. JGI-2019a]